jgi:hypothetical protein
VFSLPVRADLKAPLVATSDIATVAAKFLMDATWTGQADVPVLGPEDISPIEMAEILSSVLGRSVRYEQIPIEAYKARMVSRGMSEAFAQGLADMMTAKNGGIDNTSSRAVAPDTPTTFRQWSETVLKPAVAGWRGGEPAFQTNDRRNGAALLSRRAINRRCVQRERIDPRMSASVRRSVWA